MIASTGSDGALGCTFVWINWFIQVKYLAHLTLSKAIVNSIALEYHTEIVVVGECT